MRVVNLLPLVFLSTVVASVIPDAQVVLGDASSMGRSTPGGLSDPLQSGWKQASARIHKWTESGKTFVLEYGLKCGSLSGECWCGWLMVVPHRRTCPTLALSRPSAQSYGAYAL